MFYNERRDDKMKVNDILNNPFLKKITGVLSVAVAGIIAINNAIAEQKRDEEIEQMKTEIENLKENQEQ